MSPILGQIVLVRSGAHSVQHRAAAIVTNIRGEDIVDLTVFPGDGVMPFVLKSVAMKPHDYFEQSNKEIFWQYSLGVVD